MIGKCMSGCMLTRHVFLWKPTQLKLWCKFVSTSNIFAIREGFLKYFLFWWFLGSKKIAHNNHFHFGRKLPLASIREMALYFSLDLDCALKKCYLCWQEFFLLKISQYHKKFLYDVILGFACVFHLCRKSTVKKLLCTAENL